MIFVVIVVGIWVAQFMAAVVRIAAMSLGFGISAVQMMCTDDELLPLRNPDVPRAVARYRI